MKDSLVVPPVSAQQHLLWLKSFSSREKITCKEIRPRILMKNWLMRVNTENWQSFYRSHGWSVRFDVDDKIYVLNERNIPICTKNLFKREVNKFVFLQNWTPLEYFDM